MVRRRASAVSNHEATDGPSSFETPASQAPQDEGLVLKHQILNLLGYIRRDRNSGLAVFGRIDASSTFFNAQRRALLVRGCSTIALAMEK
jgi:hypothetical protein